MYCIQRTGIRVETILPPRSLNYNVPKNVKPTDLNELINEIVLSFLLSFLGGGDNTHTQKKVETKSVSILPIKYTQTALVI